MDDRQLLQEYARQGSRKAFEQLVSRYTDLVYSSALRRLEDPHLAEDVTQATFIVLAEKAGRIRPGTVLSGWLFKTSRYAAAEVIRRERRRKEREKVAHESKEQRLKEDEAVAWEGIRPHLDEGLDCLSAADRNAVLLRFFENKTHAQVGEALGISAAAAEKRTARALGKLRRFLGKRGVVVPVALLVALLPGQTVLAAPAGVASAVSAAAFAGAPGTALAGSALLAKGAMKMMLWAKVKMAVAVWFVVAVAGAGTGIIVKVYADGDGRTADMGQKTSVTQTANEKPVDNQQTDQVKCLLKLEQVALATAMHSSVMHTNLTTVKLKKLYLKGVFEDATEIFVCPSGKGSYWCLASYSKYGYRNAAFRFSVKSNPEGDRHVLQWRDPRQVPTSRIIFVFDAKGNHKGGQNVWYLDGHKKWLSEEAFQKEFRQSWQELKKIEGGAFGEPTITTVSGSRHNDNERNAVAALRQYAAAQATYKKANYAAVNGLSAHSYCPSFRSLGPCSDWLRRYPIPGLPKVQVHVDGKDAQLKLIPRIFASAMHKTSGYSGYYFVDAKVDAPREEFGLFAVPCVYGKTGRFTYYIGENSKVYANDLKGKAASRSTKVDETWVVAPYLMKVDHTKALRADKKKDDWTAPARERMRKEAEEFRKLLRDWRSAWKEAENTGKKAETMDVF